MTQQDTRNDLYAKTREDLLKRQLSNNENFDRAILTLSSAGLATSVAFLRGMDAESGTCFLVLSWIALVLAIVATLVSFQTSQAGISRQLELAEDYYLKQNDSALTATNRWANITDQLARWSAVCFILGIILLLCFFGSNLQPNAENSQMPNEEIPGSQKKGASITRMQRIEGGASVPSMQQVPPDDLGSSIPPMQELPPQVPAPNSGGTDSPPPAKE